jgi:hypothetical protein
MKKILALVGVVALAVSPLSITPAQGAHPHAGYVSADPADWTPHVNQGRVRGLATVDGVTVAVGNFSSVTEAAGSATFNRTDIFAFDSQGKVSTTFVPAVTGSEIYDVISAGDGEHVFVGGQFSRVNGLGGTNKLVKLNVHTGAVDRSFRPPTFNNRTTMLHIANGRLYASGAFTQVGGEAHTSLVALDLQTGAQTNHLKLSFSGTWNGGTMRVDEFAMTPDGRSLVAIGNFRNVNGQARNQIVMVDTSGATATLSSWATSRFSSTCSSSFDTYMYDVDSSPDGSYFAVVTTGAYRGGPTAGVLCDSASRWEFGRTGSGQQPTWVEYSGGDTFTAVEVTGAAIYVGGHFRWMNNPWCGDRACEGAVGRKGLAALDPRNGLPLSWNPTRLRGWGVFGFRADSQGLWLGHDTNEVGGETHRRLALMPLPGGSVPPDNTGSLPGDVYLVDPSGDRVVRNSFTGTGVTASQEVTNGGIDWSSARGAFMVDGTVYTGWADRRMTYRTFEGDSWRLTRNVNLYRNTTFINELPNIRAMWFDRVTGRLYYSAAGTTRLFWRKFTPENRLVGAQRFEVSNAGIDFGRVTGGFVAGGQLYYQTDTGNLNRVAWQNGPSGSSTTVSGPGVDGVSWTARSLFLYAP